MKIVATIEARMTSSRLPGKVLLQANGIPMLGHLVSRLRAVPSLDGIVLATTVNKTDDPLVEYAKSIGLSYFRGSEDDVLERVIGAAESAGADLLVEITGDCPIIDPQLIEQSILMYLNNHAMYVSNAHIRSYPDGMDTQVFSVETLKKSASMTNDPLDREHVSLHIRKNPDLFPPIHIVAPPELHWPDLGLTLDEIQDYELLKKIIEYFGDKKPLFTCLEAITLLKEKQEWLELNKDVKRKGNT